MHGGPDVRHKVLLQIAVASKCTMQCHGQPATSKCGPCLCHPIWRRAVHCTVVAVHTHAAPNPTAPDSTARSWPCIQESPGRGCEGDKYARRCFADMQRRGQCPSWPPHQTPQARPIQTRRPQEVGSRGPTAHSCRSRGRVGIHKWLTWQEAIDGLPRNDGAPLIQPGCRAVPLCRPVGACCLRPASVCSSLAGRL